MQARFYAPWYGRFLSPDPARDQHFEETQSWNIYSYVQNNPTMKFDPDGMAETPAWIKNAWNGAKALPGKAAAAINNFGKSVEAKVNAPRGGGSMSPEALENFKTAVETTVVNATLLQIVANETIPTGNGGQKQEAAAGAEVGVAEASGAKATSPTTESALESLAKGATFEKTTTNGGVTTHQFSKTGGAAAMEADFSAAGGAGARVAPNGTKVKALDGSNSMNSRTNSTAGKPTVEVQNKDIDVKHKFRYEN